MKGKLILALVGVVTLVGVVAGLALAQPRDLEGRALWESKGIENYRYVLSRNCFCLIRGPVVVEVRDGEVVSVVDQATGEPTVDGFALVDEFGQAATVDRLFDLIEQAEAEGAARIDVTYDETYGYPAGLYIDQSEQMADEEMGYVVTDFEVLD